MVTGMMSNNDGGQTDLWKAFVARQGRDASFDEIGDAVVMMTNPRMSLVNAHNLFCDGYVIWYP
jgi:hypothetical protein